MCRKDRDVILVLNYYIMSTNFSEVHSHLAQEESQNQAQYI